MATHAGSGERGTSPVFPRPRRSPRRRLLAGGTAGNEELTAAVSVGLLVALTALGVTILRIGPCWTPTYSSGWR